MSEVPPPNDAAAERSLVAPSASHPIGEDDWPAQATDLVVKRVEQVREVFTANVVKSARVLVFAVPILMLVAVIGVVGLTMGLRTVQIALNAAGIDPWARAVWASYLLLGGCFLALGLFIWRGANRAAVAPT